jgi:hypothetical protein
MPISANKAPVSVLICTRTRRNSKLPGERGGRGLSCWIFSDDDTVNIARQEVQVVQRELIISGSQNRALDHLDFTHEWIPSATRRQVSPALARESPELSPNLGNLRLLNRQTFCGR